jgi:hypothetical protein
MEGLEVATSNNLKELLIKLARLGFNIEIKALLSFILRSGCALQPNVAAWRLRLVPRIRQDATPTGLRRIWNQHPG